MPRRLSIEGPADDNDGPMGPPLTPIPPSGWDVVPQGDLQLVITPWNQHQQRAVVYNRTHKRFAVLPRNQIFCPLCKRGLHPDTPSPQASTSPSPSSGIPTPQETPDTTRNTTYEDDEHFEELPSTPVMAPSTSIQPQSQARKRQHRIQSIPPQNKLLTATQQQDLISPSRSQYFHLLSESVQVSPDSSQDSTPQSSFNQLDWESTKLQDHQLDPRSFVQGYYQRFFIEERKLGRGARGVVFLCEHVLEHTRLGRYAVKKISVGDSTQSLITTLREVKHLERLRHPSITSYHHSWIERVSTTAFQPPVPHLFLLMSYCNGGSLQSFINQRKSIIERESGSFTNDSKTQDEDAGQSTRREKLKQAFRERRRGKSTPPEEMNAVHHLRLDEILALFTDITAGLEFLHSHMVLHLDLKAENVLLEFDDDEHFSTPRAVLSDFGSSEARNRLQERERTGFTGTLDYVSPEALQVNPVTGKLRELDASADLWSLGLLLHLLCFLQLPYSKEDIDELKSEILAYPGFHIPDQTRRDLPISLLQILTKLLNRTPSARPSASDVLAELASEHLTVCKVSKTVELFHAEVRHEKSFDGSNVALIPRPSKIGLKAQADQIKVSFGLDGLDLQDFQTRSLFAASSLVKIWVGQSLPKNPALLVAVLCFAEVTLSVSFYLYRRWYWYSGLREIAFTDKKAVFHLHPSLRSTLSGYWTQVYPKSSQMGAISLSSYYSRSPLSTELFARSRKKTDPTLTL